VPKLKLRVVNNDPDGSSTLTFPEDKVQGRSVSSERSFYIVRAEGAIVTRPSRQLCDIQHRSSGFIGPSEIAGLAILS
jgi:hypothetical protein